MVVTLTCGPRRSYAWGEMWLLPTGVVAILLAVALQAQPPSIGDARTRPEAVRDARKQLTGRTDQAAIVQWDSVLTEMHLSKDPELKTVVHSLRALNLYDNKSWVNLVNMGYAYIGDSEGARQFRIELARRLPDSSWAVQAAIQQWESTHQPRTTTQSGFTEWGLARVEFLKGLHEGKTHSDAATREYLQTALTYESRLPEDEALAVADLALRTSHIFRSIHVFK